jgi:hypothetical protein
MIDKIKILPFKEEHAIDIAKQNEAIGVNIVGVTLASMVRAYLSSGSVALTLFVDEKPIVSAGIINLAWNRGEAWLLVGPQFYSYRKTAYKFIKQLFPALAKQKGFVRVQSVITDDRFDKIAKHLGFKYEGTLRAYAPMGRDVKMFSRIFSAYTSELQRESNG